MNHSMATSSRPPLSPHFTPIEEGNEDEEISRSSFRATTPSNSADPKHHHQPTPLHQSKPSSRKKVQNDGEVSDGSDGGDKGVSCNKCRPNSKVVDNNGSANRQSPASPNGIFRSIFSNLVKKSPLGSSHEQPSLAVPTAEQWKIAAAELSHKLIQATRKRDEAILEASRLKNSMAELEKKLNKLEIYCNNLKSGLEVCSNYNNNDNDSKWSNSNKPHNPHRVNYQISKVGYDQGEVIIEHFLVSVSEARSSVRLLSRSLTLQLGQMGGKIYDRISLLLQPYEIKVSLSRNPRGMLLYVEALLNRAFYEDFESIGFQKNAPNNILNPIDRCVANFVSFNRLQGLTWDEVLNKGTKHFSEDFSKFCDRKMSEIVAMLGWNRAWPEQLLQSFFGASKAVWLVHHLANSVHPSLPIFRVDKGASFDSIYMEDMGGEKAQKLVPTSVRIMVTPGFYVYDNVVKCKVLSRYYNSNDGYNIESDAKGGLVGSPL